MILLLGRCYADERIGLNEDSANSLTKSVYDQVVPVGVAPVLLWFVVAVESTTEFRTQRLHRINGREPSFG